MFYNSGFKVIPAFGALFAFESVSSWKAQVSDFKVLFKMFNQIAPIDYFIGLDQFDQFAKNN